MRRTNRKAKIDKKVEKTENIVEDTESPEIKVDEDVKKADKIELSAEIDNIDFSDENNGSTPEEENIGSDEDTKTEEKQPTKIIRQLVIAEVGADLKNENGFFPRAVLFETVEQKVVSVVVELPDRTNLEFKTKSKKGSIKEQPKNKNMEFNISTTKTSINYFGKGLSKKIVSTPLIPLEFVRITKCNADKIHIFY